MKLLDEIDCRLDPLEPITSYPVCEITSVDTATQAVMELTCNNDMNEFSLQSAIDMCSFVVNKCDVTQYCLQLLSTQLQGSVIIYLSIPICVVHLISAKVLQNCNYFYNKGVIEVAIHPDIRIDTGKISNLDVSFVL